MKTNFLFLLLFFSVAIYGQEVCTNGIDDDNDGLVDLNDPDCQCGSNVEVPSLIPNASFEDYTICPTNHSQLNRATGWIQATQCHFLIISTAVTPSLRWLRRALTIIPTATAW